MRKVAATIASLAFALTGFAQTGRYYVLGPTGPTQALGVSPAGGITLDAHGNLFGASYGGESGAGCIWEITADGHEVDLFDFDQADGVNPFSGVTLDAAGNLYGTCSSGGAYNDGVVWELTASKVYKILHTFGGTVTNADGDTGPDGQNPYCGVTLDASGNMFGTTANGGPNLDPVYGLGQGMIWEITSAGTYRDLYDFAGPNYDDGLSPLSGVTVDGHGDLFGTAQGETPPTTEDGPGWSPSEYGIVWEIPAGGAYTVLYDFQGSDGLQPCSGVTLDAEGNLYGVTPGGGPGFPFGYGGPEGGVLWEITSKGTYKVLHAFGGTTKNENGETVPDGSTPVSNLAIDGQGNLYGTTVAGGAIEESGDVWLFTNSGLTETSTTWEEK